jgi:hypothetical protein
MAKNFYGVLVSYAIVSTWYKNPAHLDFDGFIFQQQLDTSTGAKKDYTLIAYPVDAKGKVLKGAGIINNLPTTIAEPGPKKLVNHANMKLDLLLLNDLYPVHCTSDLEINPRAIYPPDYTAYEAVTQPLLAAIRRDLNPSPPA